MHIQQVLALGPVVPVVAIDNVKRAVPLARALLAGGVRVIEVTLRTPVALECIERIRRECNDMVVGAGTVVAPAQLRTVADAGAQFIVSPGATPALVEAQGVDTPAWLPGAATVSESMRLLDAGFVHQKFFPAGQCGGAGFLGAVRSVLPDVRYCPTGGVNADNASSYLALANVAAVGGSWLAPTAAIEAADFAAIESLARTSVAQLTCE